MKIGVFATFMSPNATPQMIRDFGQRAENMGLDSIWMGEHVVLFDKQTFGYPGSKDGRIPVPPGGGMLDVTATLGFTRDFWRPPQSARARAQGPGTTHAKTWACSHAITPIRNTNSRLCFSVKRRMLPSWYST